MMELLILCRQRPEAALFSGGTWILRSQRSRRFRLPEALVSLRGIDELRRIGRTESRIDIGAAASIQRILTVARTRLPRILRETLESIAPQGIRSLATLGGNVCVPERSMTGFPTLHILDAKLEFRRLGSSRWVPVTSSRDASGTLLIQPGEVLTRIRIPLQPWNVQHFRRIGETPFVEDSNYFSLAFVGRVQRRVLADLRFAVASASPAIYRNRDLENLLVGRRLPLPPRDVSLFLETFDEDIAGSGTRLSGFLRSRGLAVLRRLLSNLPPD